MNIKEYDGRVNDYDSFLKFLDSMGLIISEMFGKNCEVVVSDLDNPENAVIFIYNGHVTNRKVGDPLTTKSENLMEKSSSPININYKRANKRYKKEIKSSTIVMNAYGKNLSFCINYDCDEISMLSTTLKNFLSIGDELYEEIDETESLIEPMFTEMLNSLCKPFSKMKKKERVDFIEKLNDKGLFSVQKSVPYISERLGISRYTIYNYLKEINDKNSMERNK